MADLDTPRTAFPIRAIYGTTAPFLRSDTVFPSSNNSVSLSDTYLLQTWEDPSHIHQDSGSKGDNDPLDACEIGRAVASTGDVKQVKVLGVICLLDGGETDWKIIVIDVTDPLANRMNDIVDIEEHMPGLLDATRDWFRIYKVPDGKAPNDFAMAGNFRNKQ